jgi:hypothetical protein
MGKYRVDTDKGSFIVETEDTSSVQPSVSAPLNAPPITDIKYKSDTPINNYNPTAKPPESYISGPQGIQEKAQSLYRQYVPGAVQDAIANIIKVGKVSGLDQPMAAYAPAGEIIATTAQKAAAPLERSAARNYVNVLRPTSNEDVAMAERLSPKLAKAKVTAMSRGSLQNKAKEGMKFFGPKAETAFANSAPVPLAQASSVLEGVKDKFLYVKGTKLVPSGSEGLANFFDGIQKDMTVLAGKEGKIPAQIMDNYIDKINEGLVSATGGFRTNVSPGTIKKMEKQTAAAYRAMLDETRPDAAKINAMYSIHAKTNYFMEKARVAEIKSRSATLTGSSKGFGAMVEKNLPLYVRELPRKITGIFDSVPWQTLLGSTKQRIADALASGDMDEAADLMKEASKPSQSLGTNIIKR